MNYARASHSSTDCSTFPCKEDNCVNGYTAIARGCANHVLWATQVTTSERQIVASGGAPSQPFESLMRIRADIGFLLAALDGAPPEALRVFVRTITTAMPNVLRLPVDPVNQPEHLTQRAIAYIRP